MGPGPPSGSPSAPAGSSVTAAPPSFARAAVAPRGKASMPSGGGLKPGECCPAAAAASTKGCYARGGLLSAGSCPATAAAAGPFGVAPRALAGGGLAGGGLTTATPDAFGVGHGLKGTPIRVPRRRQGLRLWRAAAGNTRLVWNVLFL